MFITKKKFKETIAKELDAQAEKMHREFEERERMYWNERNRQEDNVRNDKRFEKIESQIKSLEMVLGIHRNEERKCPFEQQ